LPEITIQEYHTGVETSSFFQLAKWMVNLQFAEENKNFSNNKIPLY